MEGGRVIGNAGLRPGPLLLAGTRLVAGSAPLAQSAEHSHGKSVLHVA